MNGSAGDRKLDFTEVKRMENKMEEKSSRGNEGSERKKTKKTAGVEKECVHETLFACKRSRIWLEGH